MSELMTMKEARELLHVSKGKIRQLVRDRVLDSVRIPPNTTRIYRQSLLDLIERGRARG